MPQKPYLEGYIKDFPTRIHYVDESKPLIPRRVGFQVWHDRQSHCGESFKDFSGAYSHALYSVSAIPVHLTNGWQEDMCPHCLEELGMELLQYVL